MKPLRIGVAGLGTVGTGVVRLLKKNYDVIAKRAGRPLEVVAVAARDRKRDRGLSLDHLTWYENANDLAKDPSIDVVVELIGGAEGIAHSVVKYALEAGKAVVTANKALVAVHGAELAELSAHQNVPMMFEAAVAGGIPVIKAIREGLAADRLYWVGGILNGTCNYILSTMRQTGRSFNDVLEEAQKLGYAEADPSTDIDGIDATHKLTILAALCFGQPVDFSSVYVEGIRHIGAVDLQFAEKLGYRLKLLGISSLTGEGRLEARVHPSLVKQAHPLAGVEGVFNAVVAKGDFIGQLTLEGPGAGEGPTATAVVADLIDVARGSTVPVWGSYQEGEEAVKAIPREEFFGPYYIRLDVKDQPGVMADITACLRDCGVSLKSMLQEGERVEPFVASSLVQAGQVQIVLITHSTQEAAILKALGQIKKLPQILAEPVMIRIVSQ